MKKVLITALCLPWLLFAKEPMRIGIVNFATCLSDSKYGKQEQETFESLKKQMSTLIEDTDKQMRDISAKFNDPDYLDSLSPEAEEEMKKKFHSLNEEMQQYQSQFYQVMNQANMKVVQIMNSHIGEASEKVAKAKKLDLILNKETAFYYESSMDVTSLVISEMDREHDRLSQEEKKSLEKPEVPQQAAS